MSLDQNQNINLILEQTKKLVTTKIAPYALLWENEGKGVPSEVIKMLGDLGYFGILIDNKFGGLNQSIANYTKITEILAMGDCGLTNLVNVSNSPVAMAIERYGSAYQQSQYLNGMATGKTIGCFMLSEPSSGSDASSIETTAKKVSGGYVINGRKKFVTGGASASVALVAAKTNKNIGKKGISLFLVPRESYKIGRLENKMGHRNIDTADVIFDDSKVSDNTLLGELGSGYSICLTLLNTGRIAVAAQAIGVASAAFEQARAYALERKTFGKKLINHQSLSFRLTDMATQIISARQLALFAAQKADARERCIAESSMAKIYASEIAEKVTSSAIQIFGGDGYLQETGIEKLYRDARVLSIYEGTNDIQRIVIGREIESGWSPNQIS